MADKNETLRFDIVGNDRASGAFTRAGESVKAMGDKMDKATREAVGLDEALKKQHSAARAGIDATLALAKSDDILAEVEHRLRDGALEAEFALKKEAEAKKKSADASRRASAENAGFAASLAKVANSMQKGGGPAWLGPALALAPVFTSLLGAGAGVAAGLGGAAVAGGGALAAFGAVAKPVLADALKAEQAVQKAQDAYNIAIANGTKKAVAYKAEQVAIAKAYANMSPAQIALSKQLGDMSNAWDRVKAAETPVIAGALQPWLKSVTDLTGKLGPIIGAVSPVIRALGTDFDRLVNSSAFTGFRNFVAGTGSYAIGAAGATLTDFVKAFIILLPKFNPLIDKMVQGVADLGPAVLKWANSKKASDDITKFMGWFTKNGPAVGALFKNIGGALKALAPGLGPASAAEINVFSQFFGFIAKLPPALAKPLLEVAGVMLTLNKLGVVSVGVKYLGLLSGSGAAATGAAAGAEGAAAGGILSKLLPGIRIIGGIGIITIGIRLAGSLVPKDINKQVAADLRKQPPAAVKVTDFLHLTNLAGWIDQNFSHPIRAWLENSLPHFFIAAGHNVEHIWDVTGHDILHIWDMTWNNTITRTAKGFHDVAGWFDRGRHDTAAKLDGIRADTAHYWDVTWNNTVGRAIRGTGDVARNVGRLPGMLGAVFRGAGSWLFSAGGQVISGLWGGMKSVWDKLTGWVSSIAGWIRLHKGPLALDSRLLTPAGQAIMHGFHVGLKDGFGNVMNFVSGIAGDVGSLLSKGIHGVGGLFASLFRGGGGAGVQQWAGTVMQALAMERLSPALLGNVLYQMQTESGGNVNAINLSDFNATVLHDPSRGLMQVIGSTFSAFHWPGTSWDIYDPLANIAAALNYAKNRYGPGLMYGGMGIGSGHGYAAGTMSAAPGWAWVGERGPELMHFRGGEQVYPAQAVNGGDVYNITVNVPPTVNPREAGRQVADLLLKHTGTGGRLYPAGVTPR